MHNWIIEVTKEIPEPTQSKIRLEMREMAYEEGFLKGDISEAIIKAYPQYKPSHSKKGPWFKDLYL